MNTSIKRILIKYPIFDVIYYVRHRLDLLIWKFGITSSVPHLLKQEVVIKYAGLFSASTLVETGTYMGHMISATKSVFADLYSIELDANLYKRAKNKFNKHKHINIHQGDSSFVLPTIIKNIRPPILFWLDAHYSRGITAKGEVETPIINELKHIFSHSLENVILIDDANCFVGENDYPRKSELIESVKKIDPNLNVTEERNIIIIFTKGK